MKKKAGIITSLIVFLSVIVILTSVISSVMAIIAVVGGEEEGSGGSDANVDGLPKFITEEMLKTLFDDQEEYGIPVSTGIAQLIQESGFGVYGPYGEEAQGLSELAFKYKNLFGIKYHSCDYVKGSVNMETGEEANGEKYTTVAGFCTYKSYTDCVHCRSKNLYSSIYYPSIRAYLKKTVGSTGSYTKEQANKVMEGIAAHWATGSDYYQACKGHMEEYNLYAFDNMTWESYQKQASGESGPVSNVMIGDYAHPCPGSYVSSHFGYRSSPGGIGSTNHKGTDFAAGYGSPIYAVKSGTVETVDYNGFRGNYVKIDHGGGIATISQHMSKTAVKRGQKVKKGQLIGYVGTSGVSTGAHLHFEFWLHGTPVDAEKYMKF